MLNDKVTIFERIKWRISNVRQYPSHIATGIKNLWKWFPIIWKDRDWDSYFIYDILKFKIINQSKYIGKKNRHSSSSREAEIMMMTARLMHRYQTEYYDTEYMDYHESKYNWLSVKNTTKLKELDIELVSEKFNRYYKKYPLQYKKVMSGEINRYYRPVKQKDRKLIAMEIAHENHNRCRKLLFKVMEANIDKWWD